MKPFRRASEPQQARRELDSSYYDGVYANSAEYALDYRDSRYYFIWTVIADRIRQHNAQTVLEVGCGSGQFAEFLFDRQVKEYVGLDFSPTAIANARKRVPAFRFEVEDARTGHTINSRKWDCIICTEVLEHIEDDLSVVSKWPEGTYCIATVPDFDYESHVRFFQSAASVVERYGKFFDDFNITVFDAPGPKKLKYFLYEGRRNSYLCDAAGERETKADDAFSSE